MNIRRVTKACLIGAITILLAIGALDGYLYYLDQKSEAKAEYEGETTEYFVSIMNAVYEIEALAAGDLTQEKKNRISELTDVVALNAQKGMILDSKGVSGDIHEVYVEAFEKWEAGAKIIMGELGSANNGRIEQGLDLFETAEKEYISGSEKLFAR